MWRVAPQSTSSHEARKDSLPTTEESARKSFWSPDTWRESTLYCEKLCEDMSWWITRWGGK